MRSCAYTVLEYSSRIYGMRVPLCSCVCLNYYYKLYPGQRSLTHIIDKRYVVGFFCPKST